MYCSSLFYYYLLSSEFIKFLFSIFKGTLYSLTYAYILLLIMDLLKLFYGIIWLLVYFVFIHQSLSAVFILGITLGQGDGVVNSGYL